MSGTDVLIVVNRYLYDAIRAALEGLSDKQLVYIAQELDGRRLGEVAVHAYRPVLAATAIVAGQPWPPRRPQPSSSEALQSLLKDMVAEVDTLLRRLPEEALAVPVELRWGRRATGSEAIVECLAHGFVHAGAIRGARAIGGFPTPAED